MNQDDSQSMASGSKSNLSDGQIHKVEYHGDAGEFIKIGKQKFHRHELMQAFGGTLNPGATPYPKLNINPAPVGLAAFSLTLFVLSLYLVEAFGIKVPNVFVGLGCFYGGGVQFIAGIGCLFANNTFGATALASFGCFWMSLAALYIPSFGIQAAYADAPEQFSTGVAFFFFGWAIFALLLTSLTLKSTVSFFLLFSSVTLLLILLGCGEITGNITITRVAGGFAMFTAVLGWYNTFAGVATESNSYFTMHAINMPGNDGLGHF